MSDFLASLIARARGEAPVVRPRLRSRFESADDGIVAGNPFGEIVEETLAPTPEHRDAPTLPAREFPPPAPMTAADPYRSAPRPVATAAAEPMPEVSAREGEPPRTEARPMEPGYEVRREPQATQSAPDRTVEQVTISHVVETEIATQRVLEERISSQTNSASPEVTQPAASSPPLQPPAIASRPAAPIPVLGLERERPAPSPTIEINIGRIEVRAAAAPALRSERSQTASPVMSLNEYLRSRTRGGR